ncbi:MAG: purine-nucleoside phosphorylase [Candidatus Kapabacteria bacterium]|nr:purine-nucleoside phosphorylase [Candidatus Kapabacteria bacterium]
MFGLTKEYSDYYSSVAKSFRTVFSQYIDAFVIIGSGLSESYSQFEIVEKIPYSAVDGFPKIGVAGHLGEFVLCKVNTKNILFFSGRVHFYEGRKLTDLLIVPALAAYLGVKDILVTNAAGGLNHSFEVSDIMLIEDLMSFMFLSVDQLFRVVIPANAGISYAAVEMDSGIHINNKKNGFTPIHIRGNLRNEINHDLLHRMKDNLIQRKQHFRCGTLLSVQGPNYETPAEIRMYSKIADAIGMSTVPELIFGSRLGLRQLGVSIITNKLNPIKPDFLSHEEVVIAGKNANRALSELFSGYSEII